MTPAECGLFAIVGLVLLGVGWPLVHGKIAPNWLIGFRTPRLVNDPRAWYPANRVAGRGLQGAGAAIIAVSAVLAALASAGLVASPLLALSLFASPIAAMLLHLIVRVSLLVYDLDHPPIAAPTPVEPVATPEASTSTAQGAAAARATEREGS